MIQSLDISWNSPTRGAALWRLIEGWLRLENAIGTTMGLGVTSDPLGIGQDPVHAM